MATNQKDSGVREKGYHHPVYPVEGDADHVHWEYREPEELRNHYPLPEEADPAPDLSNRYPHLPLIELRPGATAVMGTEQVVEAAGAHVLEVERLKSAPHDYPGAARHSLELKSEVQRILDHCRLLPSPEKFQAGRFKDMSDAKTLITQLKSAEQAIIASGDHRYPAAAFDLGQEQFQTLDGSITAAPITLLLHFPNAHTDGAVLTYKAYSTRYIKSFDIATPSSVKPGQIAVINAVPVKSHVDGETNSIQVAPIPGKPRAVYPASITKLAVDHRVDVFINQLKNDPTDRLLVAYGSGHSQKIIHELLKRAKRDGMTIETFKLRRRLMRRWELGMDCGELSVLKMDIATRSTPWPADYKQEPLFPHHSRYQRDEKTRDLARNDPLNMVTLNFTIIRASPTAATLILNLPHPQTTSVTHQTHANAFHLDLGMNLIANLTGHSRPLWRGCRIHAAASARETDLGKVYRIAQKHLWINNKKALLPFEVLPWDMQRHAQRVRAVKVATAEEGIECELEDWVERADFGMKELKREQEERRRRREEIPEEEI